MTEKLCKIEEIALIVGVSAPTINIWYRWKRNHPTHELASLLPEFQQTGARQTRYWKQSDAWQLIKFKQSLPHGRNGILGDTTQRYCKKKR